MAKRHKLDLSEEEKHALIELRDKGEPAYLRERAAALLKIHAGWSPHKVAQQGLLKKRALTPCMTGSNATEQTALMACSIDLAEGENLLLLPSPLKKPRRNS